MTRSASGSRSISRRDTWIAAALTIGAALAVSAMMIIGHNPLTKSIGIVMLPGILTIGTLWTSLRGRSLQLRVAIVGGTMTVLFLIGLFAGLAIR